jgi:hypothetical protein
MIFSLTSVKHSGYLAVSFGWYGFVTFELLVRIWWVTRWPSNTYVQLLHPSNAVGHGPRPSKTATWICGGSKIHPDLPIRTGAVSLPGRQASDARVLLLRRDASWVYIVCGIKGRDFREHGWQEVSNVVIKISLKRRLVTPNSVFIRCFDVFWSK